VAAGALIWVALYNTSGLQFAIRHYRTAFAGVQLVTSSAPRHHRRRPQCRAREIDHDLVQPEFEGHQVSVASSAAASDHPATTVGAQRTHSSVEAPHPAEHQGAPGVPCARWLIISAESVAGSGASWSPFPTASAHATDIRTRGSSVTASIRFFHAKACSDGRSQRHRRAAAPPIRS